MDPMIEAQARAAYENATETYLTSLADPASERDDVVWAYEAMVRAKMKLRSFDVV